MYGSNKVLFIVLDGLTQDLINRVSTNTLDKLIQNGANFTLKPGNDNSHQQIVKTTF